MIATATISIEITKEFCPDIKNKHTKDVIKTIQFNCLFLCCDSSVFININVNVRSIII